MKRKKCEGEVFHALAAGRGLFASAFIFSMVVNLLMLTGPIYMLQVYDRVIASRSEETLTALTLLVVFLYLVMGILDYARGRVMARAGARFQALLDYRVFSASLERAALDRRRPDLNTGLRDLEAVQQLFSSPAVFAIFDIPWTPVFLLGIFVFHPWLGYLALGGGVLLIFLTFVNQITTATVVAQAVGATARATHLAGTAMSQAETVRALGMRDAIFGRWLRFRTQSLERTILASDLTGTFSAAIRALRMFLQSAMLGLGAYLVLKDQLSAGAMVAGSILLGRALAPIEQAIAQWPLVQHALAGWKNLSDLLNSSPREPPHTPLPAPRAILDVQQLTVIPPGQKHAALRMVSFRIEPGSALGVIGPSGAGKTTLARAIAGIWPHAGGAIRLDGAAIGQYSPDELGRHIGYLPQHVALFDGTVADNIARMSASADPEKIVAAARLAGAHEMILQLPDGYDTWVDQRGGGLSGGQVQRVGLARALYGNPALVVLDEPNSNLDAEGGDALNLAIRSLRKQGRAVIITAHRPAAISECDLLLVLENGMRREFGPRDEVLRTQLRNHHQVALAVAPEGAR
ncbi:MAG: type I secretion system permease/ATPase [Paracoccaceae bacterium]|nr:type I secretion system permease/ATPase [Paracoccaceae bacterium]